MINVPGIDNTQHYYSMWDALHQLEEIAADDGYYLKETEGKCTWERLTWCEWLKHVVFCFIPGINAPMKERKCRIEAIAQTILGSEESSTSEKVEWLAKQFATYYAKGGKLSTKREQLKHSIETLTALTTTDTRVRELATQLENVSRELVRVRESAEKAKEVHESRIQSEEKEKKGLRDLVGSLQEQYIAQEEMLKQISALQEEIKTKDEAVKRQEKALTNQASELQRVLKERDSEHSVSETTSPDPLTRSRSKREDSTIQTDSNSVNSSDVPPDAGVTETSTNKVLTGLKKLRSKLSRNKKEGP